MTKASLKAIRDYLAEKGDLPEILEEIKGELAKGEKKAEANRALYEQAKPIVLGALSATPVPLSELWGELEGHLPEGMTKSKVSRGLNNEWAKDIAIVNDGTANLYGLKA